MITNNDELMRALGVGLRCALGAKVASEIARGKLRVVLEPHLPEVPGLFLHLPSRAQVSPARSCGFAEWPMWFM